MLPTPIIDSFSLMERIPPECGQVRILDDVGSEGASCAVDLDWNLRLLHAFCVPSTPPTICVEIQRMMRHFTPCDKFCPTCLSFNPTVSDQILRCANISHDAFTSVWETHGGVARANTCFPKPTGMEMIGKCSNSAACTQSEQSAI